MSADMMMGMFDPNPPVTKCARPVGKKNRTPHKLEKKVFVVNPESFKTTCTTCPKRGTPQCQKCSIY